MSEAGENAEVAPENSPSDINDAVKDTIGPDDVGPTGDNATTEQSIDQSIDQNKESEDVTDSDESKKHTEEEEENEEEKNTEETLETTGSGDVGIVMEEESENAKESSTVDDMTAVEDSPAIEDSAVNEDSALSDSTPAEDSPIVEDSLTVKDSPTEEDLPELEDSPIAENTSVAAHSTDVEDFTASDSQTETDIVENVEGTETDNLTENNDKDQTTDIHETENVCDSLQDKEDLKNSEESEVTDEVHAETEETSNTVQSPEDEDELLEDDKDLKNDEEEDGKQEEQYIIDEDKLLEDEENKDSAEMLEKSESNDSTERKSDESKQDEEQNSPGDMMLQIGSVTGNAEMLDDTEMMDVDQNSSKKETEEETGENSRRISDADEGKKDDDVEMADAEKEVKKDEESDVQNDIAEVKDTDNDVEMKKDGDKNIKCEDKLKEVKSEPIEKPKANKSAEEEDDDDVKIIDIQSDDEEDKVKDKNVSVKDEKKDDKSVVENGEMCLQIASVSGGVDMPEQNFEDKKEGKREQDIKIKEETVSKDIKQEPKSGEAKPKSTSKTQTCIVCQKIGKCKYNIVRNGDIKHLCDDVCFKQFRANPTMFLRASSDTQVTKKPESPAQAPPPSVPPPSQERYKTCSICQLMNVKTSKPFLNWQCMDFCGEDCLGKFQAGLNAACNYCGQTVQQASKGKFCARVDNDVKQFCSGPCYNEFKKRQKLCEFCQKDVTKISDAFVAPVGKDALFKDFCSQGCLQKYEEKSNRDVEIVGIDRPQKSQVPPKGNFQCAVCRKTGPVKHEIKLEGRMNRLCGDPCFSAFQYANKLTMNTCDNCGVYCYNEGMAPQYIQFEGQQKRFCSFMCVNTFKTLNKKVVSCAWCNCKKSNFDMIERVDANNKYQLFCSLNCLSLYRVNLQATSNQAVVCDQCRKFVPAQYHLTMSDASVRNFCSYQCVMTFQSQFAGGANKSQTPIMNTAPQNQKTPTPRTNNKNTPTRASSRVVSSQQKQTHVPVISNVVSLSSQNTGPQQVMRNTQMPTLVNSQAQPRPSVTTTAMQTPPQQIIIQPPPPKTVKNKSLLCKPFVQTKATSCRPHTQTKETQTEDDWTPKQCLVPIPIPYYIPVPMMMYTQYTPVPIPIPVPIPVPCFIPTTKKSASSIFKHIKEIQERIPSDPLEAELLMMAEAVAVADPESESESDNEDILPPSKTPPADGNTVSDTPSPIPDPVPEVTAAPGQPNGEFGEDMLQMALRMATEMTSEPVLDLESSIAPVPVNTDIGLRRTSLEEIDPRTSKVKHLENQESSPNFPKDFSYMVTALNNEVNFSCQTQVENIRLQRSQQTDSFQEKDYEVRENDSTILIQDFQDNSRNSSRFVKVEDSEESSRNSFQILDMEYLEECLKSSSSDTKENEVNQDQHAQGKDEDEMEAGVAMESDFDMESDNGRKCVLDMEAMEEEYNYIMIPSDGTDDEMEDSADFVARDPTKTNPSLVPIHPLLQNLRNEMILDVQNQDHKECADIQSHGIENCNPRQWSNLETYDLYCEGCGKSTDFKKSETERYKKTEKMDQATVGHFKHKMEKNEQDATAKQSDTISKSKPIASNTRRSTKWGVNIFKAWCERSGLSKDLCVITPSDLAKALETFYTDRCEQFKYQKQSILTIRSSIKRHLRHIGRDDIDIVKDLQYIRANAVIKTMIKTGPEGRQLAGMKPYISGFNKKTSNSTKNVTKWTRKMVQDWCRDHEMSLDFASVTPEKLASILERFYMEATRKRTSNRVLGADTGTYKKSTLYLIRSGLNRYFRDIGRPINVSKDMCFVAANHMLKRKF
ncbi:zinc finger MYM-type protein 2-like isoform X2 [Mizuhopecten yessoensis]|uniref:zinc finger MYM-type protein 2-like isoform X2 n=1 Tax=Mizuhopecten yessoensis TaxID=6573 RepID=UPI000B45B641|nr:zinc finger MYM-type protein 2-like isoform X2 [Mizuhopecten yessoensis]